MHSCIDVILYSTTTYPVSICITTYSLHHSIPLIILTPTPDYRWDYDNLNYFDAMSHLMDLQQHEKIKNIGLTNFDTEHMVKLIKEDAPIVSNQISLSILVS